MNKNRLAGCWVAVLGMVVICLVGPVFAQDAASTYKAKCVSCHGQDGSGSAMGKKLGAHDFNSPEVQKMTDEELGDAISRGKNKMPAYKTMKPEDVKGLVAYVRSLAQK